MTLHKNSLVQMYKKIVYTILFIMLLFSMAGCMSKFEKAQREKQMEVTLSSSHIIEEYLTKLVIFLDASFAEIGEINRNTFNIVSASYPEVSSILLYDTKLTISRRFPENFNYEEVPDNCLTQKTLSKLEQMETPFIGHSLFKENDVFLCIGFPIIDPTTQDRRILFVLINTAILFSKFEQSDIKPYPYSLIVINDEQEIVYDSDPMRIGQDFLLEDDIGDHVLARKNLYNMITENQNDYFVIQIREKNSSLRKIYTWNTIDVFGERFYISLVRNLTSCAKQTQDNSYLLSTLRSYAIKDTLIDPIIEGSTSEIDKLLEYLYQQNPETYAIQLVDTSGTIISGWPRSNTTLGYSIKMQKNKTFDTAVSNVIRTKEEYIIETPLLEGGVGRIIFLPVLVHEELYGVLFAIEPKGS